MSAKRCKAALDWAVTQSHADGRALAGADLLDDPCSDDPKILCKRSGSAIRVQLHFADGGSAEQVVYCGVGGQYLPRCSDTPEIMLAGPILGGYWDTPGTTLPPIPAAVRAASRALRVGALDIAIDHIGHYEVEAGGAVLPMGIISSGTMHLADATTQAVTVSEDGVRLEVRSKDPNAKPFDNVYARGWHDGTEAVDALLVFDVLSFTPGAKLEVRDLVIE
jgi:hypothetical protein